MIKFSKYKLGELITSIQTGKTPSTANPLYFEGDILWVTPSDLKGQKYISSTERNISKQALIDKQAFLYSINTILISTIGDIGKVVLIDKPVASNQQLTGIKVREELILPDFFYYWMLRNKEHLLFKANKAVLPILNNKNLKSISIEIPSELEYQRKISIQLDTIQSLISHRLETLNILNNLKKIVFLDMFASKAPQWEYNELSHYVINTQYGIASALDSTSLNGTPTIRMNNITYQGDLNLTDLKFIELDEEQLKNTN